MEKQQAVFVAYLLAEALNDWGLLSLLKQSYGTRGIEYAVTGIQSLAKEFAFEMPVLDAAVYEVYNDKK